MQNPYDTIPPCGFFGLKEPEELPGDSRVDFFYWPTYIATGIIMTILTIYPKPYNSDRFTRATMSSKKACFIINGCLRGCTERNFNGFGYDDVHGKVEVMEFFTDINIYAFYRKNRCFSKEFMKCYGGALGSLKRRPSGEWGDDYSERIERIEKKIEDARKKQNNKSYRTGKTRLERLNPEQCSAEKRVLSRAELIVDALKHNDITCGFILEQDVELLQDRYDVDSKRGLSGIDESALFLEYGSAEKGSPLLFSDS